jgi:ankyrin repeat protein
MVAQRYRIVDSLGQGGSGTTYLAEDLQSGQPVALKALSLRHMTDWKPIALFEREARVLAQLNHPAIPRYLEYFHVDTASNRSFYIAQQLAPGESLAALVQKAWRASQEEVRHIAIQILEILVYLHELTPPVTHRDIKPSNIIRNLDGQVFLVDFGAVQDTYYNTFMRGSTVVGTYGYMAPEQFRGQSVPATDLYGLAATLLFLLTHRSPTDLPTDGLKLDFRSRVQIPEEFADWLEKMLEPDVEDRFRSAKEALFMLRDKQTIGAKPRLPLPWKAIVGLGAAAVATTAAVTVLNSHKWVIFGKLGFMPPRSICENSNAIANYLNQGGDPNAVVEVNDSSEDFKLKSQSLLECAVTRGYKDIVEQLIAKGVDVTAKSPDWMETTMLHLAAESYEKTNEVAELLIAKGVDVNAKDKHGQTPLHKAAYQHNKDLVELLIVKGADVNAKDQNGDTPLHSAMSNYNDINGNKDVIALLLAKGADVNAKDSTGMTALRTAITGSRKDVVALLIANGADINAKDKDGKNGLLRFAAKYGSKGMVELLKRHGAKE